MAIWPYVAVAALQAGTSYLGSKSRESERRRRRAELVRQYGEYKRQELGDITRQTLAAMSSARQAASRRAQALGRMSEAESFILPAESQVAEQGFEAGERAQRRYEQALLGVETSFADRPIEPTVGEYLAEIGVGAVGFQQNEQLLNIFRNAYGMQDPQFKDWQKYLAIPPQQPQSITNPRWKSKPIIGPFKPKL